MSGELKATLEIVRDIGLLSGEVQALRNEIKFLRDQNAQLIAAMTPTMPSWIAEAKPPFTVTGEVVK